MFSRGNKIKFYKRLNVYRSGAFTFRVDSTEAYSYQWCFYRVINGVHVLNLENMSPTTTNHQGALSSLLDELKLPVDLVIYTSASLREHPAHVGSKALHAEICMELKRSPYPATPDFSTAQKIAETFQIKFTQAMVDACVVELEERVAIDRLEASVKRQEQKLEDLLKRLNIQKFTGHVEQPQATTEQSQPAEVFPWAA